MPYKDKKRRRAAQAQSMRNRRIILKAARDGDPEAIAAERLRADIRDGVSSSTDEARYAELRRSVLARAREADRLAAALA